MCLPLGRYHFKGEMFSFSLKYLPYMIRFLYVVLFTFFEISPRPFLRRQISQAGIRSLLIIL